MVTQTPARAGPRAAVDSQEAVHFAAGASGMACNGDFTEDWQRTFNTDLVTCPQCRQSGPYWDLIRRFRRPIETHDDKGYAWDRVFDFWGPKLRRSGLHHAQALNVRVVHTGTGLAYGIFAAPQGEAGIERMPGTGARPWRLLVTGSRTWDDPVLIRESLAEVLRNHPEAVMISGHAKRGADVIFEQEWATLLGFSSVAAAITAKKIEIFPVTPGEWREQGRKAGNLRNGKMLATGIDQCIAAADPCREPGCRRRKMHDTHGTSDCIDRAIKAGIVPEVLRCGDRIVRDIPAVQMSLPGL